MLSERLDLELVARGFADNRSKAQSLITDNRVTVGGLPARKTGQKVTPETTITVEARDHDWVGRGAYKLIAALDHFDFKVDGYIAADIGASTGGFSEVLLSRGAAKIFAVDVGHGQLHSRLQNDPRLINLEGLNAKALGPNDITEPLDIVVSDVSFISLTKVLPAALSFCKPGAYLAALIKPQFEVGRQNVGKGGIVKNPKLVQKVRVDMENWIGSIPGWRSLGTTESPITGAEGNREFLLGAVYDA